MIKKILPVVLGLALAGGGFFAYTTFFVGRRSGRDARAGADQGDEGATRPPRRSGSRSGSTVRSCRSATRSSSTCPTRAASRSRSSTSRCWSTPATPLEAAAEGSDRGPKLEEQTEIRDLVIDVDQRALRDELSTAEGRDQAEAGDHQGDQRADPQDGRARGVLHRLRDPAAADHLMADELDHDAIEALIAAAGRRGGRGGRAGRGRGRGDSSPTTSPREPAAEAAPASDAPLTADEIEALIAAEAGPAVPSRPPARSRRPGR